MVQKSVPHSPVILDVTLRDGGYLNQWQFRPQIVDQAVKWGALAQADYIEVGYLDNQMGLPESAACSPQMLQRLKPLAKSSRLAGMIRPSVKDPDTVLRQRQELLDLLRIPVDLRAPERAIEMAFRCHEYGFACTFNFTSVNCFPLEQIQAIAAQSPDFLQAIYLADSRGTLTPAEISPLIAAVRRGWPGAIGFHAHNSLGHALANTQAALESGCTWIDGSIAGVGLGGRNLPLATALELAMQERPELQPDPLALVITEADLELPAPGTEMILFRKAAERNLRMDWICPLSQGLGEQNALDFIDSLPVRNWFEPEELKPFLKQAWTQISW